MTRHGVGDEGSSLPVDGAAIATRPGRAGAENDTLASVHACGCITAALVETHSSARDVREFYRDAAASGCEIRRTTAEALRRDPNWFPSECPHDPKGWEHQAP